MVSTLSLSGSTKMALRVLLGKIASRGGSEWMKPPNPCAAAGGLLLSVVRSRHYVCRRCCPCSKSDLAQMRTWPRHSLSRSCGGGYRYEVDVKMPAAARAAHVAVKLYNEQKNTKLELVRLLKANATLYAGWWFVLRLEAVDHATGEKNKYEAQVWVDSAGKREGKLDYLKLASYQSSMLL